MAVRASGADGTRWLRRGIVPVLLLDGAAPFWSGRFLPLLDIPQHLALADVLVRWHDSAAGFPSFYRVSFALSPYWGYYLPMYLLGQLLPIEVANKLYLSLWAVALPVSVAVFLRAVGRDWRWAAFALPLIWNRHLFFGFTTFLASLPLFFVTMAVGVCNLEAERPRRRLLAAQAALLCAVFATHVQTFLFAVLCSTVLLAVEARSLSWALRRATALAPSLLLFGAWLVVLAVAAEPAMTPLHAVHRPRFGNLGDPESLSFETPRELVSGMAERVWGAYADGSDYLVGGAWLVLLAGAAIATRIGASRPRRDRGTLRARLGARKAEMVLALALLSYLLLPYELAGQPYFNVRYLIFAALAAPVLLPGPVVGRRRLWVAAVGALALAADLNAAWKIGLFQREVGGFAAVLERMRPGGRTLGLIFDRGEGTIFRLGPFLHFAAYYQVERGGDVGFSFAGLPAIPVRYRPGMQAPHPDEWNPLEFEWDTMASYYDYFLVRGLPAGGAAGLGEQARLEFEVGAWRLYGRRPPESSAEDDHEALDARVGSVTPVKAPAGGS